MRLGIACENVPAFLREAVLRRIISLLWRAADLPGMQGSITGNRDITDRTPEAFDRWFDISGRSILHNEGHISLEDLALLSLADKKEILVSVLSRYRFDGPLEVFRRMTPVPRSTRDGTTEDARYNDAVLSRVIRGWNARDAAPQPAAVARPAAVPSNAWTPPNRSMSNTRHLVECKPLIEQLTALLMDPISHSVIITFIIRNETVTAEQGTVRSEHERKS